MARSLSVTNVVNGPVQPGGKVFDATTLPALDTRGNLGPGGEMGTSVCPQSRATSQTGSLDNDTASHCGQGVSNSEMLDRLGREGPGGDAGDEPSLLFEDEVDAVAPTGDMAMDYAAFDNNAEMGALIAEHYLTSATLQTGTLQAALVDASFAFDGQSASKAAANTLWKSIALEALWTGISLIPAGGPIATSLKAVATQGEFYAAALKAGLNFALVTAPKTYVNYKGPTAPESGDVSTITDLVASAIDSVQQEADIKRNFFLALRSGWQINSRAVKPESWTFDAAEWARTYWSPIVTVSKNAYALAFEQILWEEYLANHVQAYWNLTVTGWNSYGFDGLSEDTLCYLNAKFGWDQGAVFRMTGGKADLPKDAESGFFASGDTVVSTYERMDCGEE